jgi:hypothetical protein
MELTHESLSLSPSLSLSSSMGDSSDDAADMETAEPTKPCDVRRVISKRILSTASPIPRATPRTTGTGGGGGGEFGARHTEIRLQKRRDQKEKEKEKKKEKAKEEQKEAVKEVVKNVVGVEDDQRQKRREGTEAGGGSATTTTILGYQCVHNCGFLGSFEDVAHHERSQVCCSNAGNSNSADTGTLHSNAKTVTVTAGGGGGRIGSDAATKTTTADPRYECDRGCGFTGPYTQVSEHELACVHVRIVS